MEKRPRMVGWYDPFQLLRTGLEVLLSGIFGRHADRRIVQAILAGPAEIHDYSTGKLRHIPLEKAAPILAASAGPDQSPEEFWIDYTADVGDGWDSTYAIAYAIAQSQKVLDQDRNPHQLTAGKILVFGGDQVYPMASPVEYRQRFVAPYEAAFADGHHPDIFAIPGNHDWYDSLVSFSRFFCSTEPLAGCDTPQRRSYFALRLPYNWWLLGTDVQLGSDLDAVQLDFFRKLIEDKIIGEKDRIILCTPEPHWVYSRLPRDKEDADKDNALIGFEKYLGSRLAVSIAGDVHHYCRYATADGTQKITAGGGGAFLHPTHGPLDFQELDGGFIRQKSYPSRSKSRALSWRNLLFPIWNPRFGLLTGGAYVLILWALLTSIRSYMRQLRPGEIQPVEPFQIENLTSFLLNLLNQHPLEFMFWGFALGAVFVVFTDVRSKVFRILVGGLHGSVHALAAILLSISAFHLCVYLWGLQVNAQSQVVRLLICTALVFLGGYLIGPMIWGIYLFLSVNVCGHHWNESFSSLGIPDWKSFLRLKLSRDGSLTIYPIGIATVPRAWADRQGNSGPKYVPVGEINLEVIEEPVQVNRPGENR